MDFRIQNDICKRDISCFFLTKVKLKGIIFLKYFIVEYRRSREEKEMKRFFRTALLVTLVLSTSLVGLTGCEGVLGNISGIVGGGQSGGTSGTHSHIWNEWVTKEAATCIAVGREERSCKLCDAVENRTMEITDNHNFQSDVCVWCGRVFGLDDYFRFTMLQDGTYSITAKQYVPKHIIIPKEYNGRAVTVIGQ